MSEENSQTDQKQETETVQLSPINQPGHPDWLFDPIGITGVELLGDTIATDEAANNSKVIFTIQFADFMSLNRSIKVNREDIYLNWPSVLARLIKSGYRYNVLKDGDKHVHAFLAHHFIPAEKTAEAFKKFQKKQEAGEAIEEAAQKMVQMMSKERTNLLRRNSN